MRGCGGILDAAEPARRWQGSYCPGRDRVRVPIFDPQHRVRGGAIRNFDARIRKSKSCSLRNVSSNMPARTMASFFAEMDGVAFHRTRVNSARRNSSRSRIIGFQDDPCAGLLDFYEAVDEQLQRRRVPNSAATTSSFSGR